MAETWDETKPAGSRNPILGDDDIREFKRATRERLAQDHEFAATESPAFGESGSVIGFHKKAILTEQASNPTVPADSIGVFGKLVDSQCELHVKDEAGNVMQITQAGQLMAPDHNTNATPGVANVVMGTGDPPTASTVPLGTIFIKYTA